MFFSRHYFKHSVFKVFLHFNFNEFDLTLYLTQICIPHNSIYNTVQNMHYNMWKFL